MRVIRKNNFFSLFLIKIKKNIKAFKTNFKEKRMIYVNLMRTEDIFDMSISNPNINNLITLVK